MLVARHRRVQPGCSMLQSWHDQQQKVHSGTDVSLTSSHFSAHPILLWPLLYSACEVCNTHQHTHLAYMQALQLLKANIAAWCAENMLSAQGIDKAHLARVCMHASHPWLLSIFVYCQHARLLRTLSVCQVFCNAALLALQRFAACLN